MRARGKVIWAERVTKKEKWDGKERKGKEGRVDFLAPNLPFVTLRHRSSSHHARDSVKHRHSTREIVLEN